MHSRTKLQFRLLSSSGDSGYTFTPFAEYWRQFDGQSVDIAKKSDDQLNRARRATNTKKITQNERYPKLSLKPSDRQFNTDSCCHRYYHSFIIFSFLFFEVFSLLWNFLNGVHNFLLFSIFLTRSCTVNLLCVVHIQCAVDCP